LSKLLKLDTEKNNVPSLVKFVKIFGAKIVKGLEAIANDKAK
jgi:hypothetical protein